LAQEQDTSREFLFWIHEIHRMFLGIWACTTHVLIAAQMMETNIALQEADKQARFNRVEVFRVKFAEAAKLKAAT
jgi:hypothetical protein